MLAMTGEDAGTPEPRTRTLARWRHWTDNLSPNGCGSKPISEDGHSGRLGFDPSGWLGHTISGDHFYKCHKYHYNVMICRPLLHPQYC